MRVDRIKLVAEMAKRDLTATRLAELTGLSRITVSCVKNGKSCSKETAEKLAAILGHDIIEKGA